MFFGSIALLVDQVRSMRRVYRSFYKTYKPRSFSIYWMDCTILWTDIVVDGIISKLQCFVFCVKMAMNKVPAFMKTLILGNK